jgi:antitoxin (DNA-binding transcriptional repressor) of toxin-antitoxin stability system
MTQFNIAEANANFSNLLKKAIRGEKIITATFNKPLLRLYTILQDKPKISPLGTGKHKVLYSADDFDHYSFNCSRLPPQPLDEKVPFIR